LKCISRNLTTRTEKPKFRSLAHLCSCFVVIGAL